MDRATAISKIEFSIEQGSIVECPKGLCPEEYLACQIDNLREKVIDPIEINVVSGTYSEYEFEKLKESNVFAIAGSARSWLRVLEEEQEFALDYGENPKEIQMLGLSSTDVMTEWLG